jgi:drug/metabolite transporter (DMT)-like permease
MTWFVLSVLSAFFQVLRNMTMKRLGHELDEYFNVWGRFTFILPFTLLFSLLHGFPALRPGYWPACAVFAVTQNAGTLCLSKALKLGDISVVTAVWKLSLIVLLVAGYFTLREVPTVGGVLGLLVTIAGVYLINLRSAGRSPWAPLAALVTDRGLRYTLFAALLYAPSVLAAKAAVLASDAYLGALGPYAAASLLVTPLVLMTSRHRFRFVPRYWMEFLGLGLFATLTSICHGFAYQLTLSSYVEAVKQVEVLFALGIGWVVFGERERVLQSLWGCLTVVAGAVLINLAG